MNNAYNKNNYFYYRQIKIILIIISKYKYYYIKRLEIDKYFHNWKEKFWKQLNSKHHIGRILKNIIK